MLPPQLSMRYLTVMATKKTLPAAKPAKPLKLTGKARTLSSKKVFTSRVFWVTSDKVTEPGNPTVVSRDVIRQYRHAAEKILFELPAGRIELGEKLIPAARRELIEETGYRARRWSRLTRYYASPGFLSEAMNILLAEDLTLGLATPEDDEKIELHMTPLSEVLRLIHAGKIEDGKTLIGVLLYASRRSAQAV
jgi:ADP-ribose pyrophosphatase